MAARILCGGLYGVDGFLVDLEVDVVRRGLPAFVMVGLPDGAVRESRERVTAALRAVGFELPAAHVTVNLAPAERRKDGGGFDLPIAVGLLAAGGGMRPENAAGWFLAGELSLDGRLRPVSGILPLAVLAKAEGAKGMIVPSVNAREAAMVAGLPVYGFDGLDEVRSFLSGDINAVPANFSAPDLSGGPECVGDFAEVRGQEQAKRAVVVAAAGGHNILFVGPPGSGKSMLAHRIPGILPPLTFEEALEVSRIHSVAGRLPAGGFVGVRPFVEGHPSASEIALIGGGVVPRPGAVSLAHRGVLFLDELPEYPRAVLDSLRQPLEEGRVTVARAAQSVVFPAECMLVAAMNPCPCGYLGDKGHECRCTDVQILRYRARLSGPLLDRIDLHIAVSAVRYDDLTSGLSGMSSAGMRAAVVAARNAQRRRFKGVGGCRTNADIGGRLLDEFCRPDVEGAAFLRRAMERLSLSARAYARILRVARTVADLDGSETVRLPHVAEAVACRLLDRGR